MINAAAASQLMTTAQATAASNAKASKASPPSSTAAADSKLAAAKDALSRMQATAASAKASPSELAKAKLNALKERLKMLMMMGGDPKTVAKQAAQIAKEIGAAAKEYADSAGGSDTGAAAEASSATASAQQDAASTQGAAQAGAAQAGANESESASNTAEQPVADPAQSAGAQDPDASAADPSKSDDTPTDPAQAKAPDQAPTEGQTTSTPSAPHHGSAPKSKLPDPVIEEARVLEASAKAIAKAAMAKLKAQHRNNPDAKTEQANLDQGEKDFNDAAKEIYGDTGSPGGGDVADSYAADGSGAAPAADTAMVSIKA
jgi:hypothetical protein